VNIRIILHC